MHTLTMFSLKGGCGNTLLAANLTHVWHQQGHSVLAIDACPDNQLRLPLGMPLSSNDGHAWAKDNNLPWHESAWLSPAGVPFLPFGYPAPQTMAALMAKDYAHSNWLRQTLTAIELPDNTRCVVDGGTLNSPLLATALAPANTVLIILSSDAMVCVPLKQLETHLLMALTPENRPRYYFVLNRFSANRSLDRDMRSLAQEVLGTRMAPVVVHEDESMREALVMKQTVFEYAPHSQAAEDIQRLSIWLSALIGTQTETPT